MIKAIKYILIFSCVAPVSFAAAYFSYPLFHPAETKTKEILPITTFTQNLTSSFEIKNANVTINRLDGDSYIGDTLDSHNLSFTSEDTLYASLNGKLGLSTMTFSGDINTSINSKEVLHTNFIYDGSKIYLGANIDGVNPKICFSASSIADIMKLIPVDGMSDLPNKIGIGEINLSELSNILSGMTDVTETYANQGYSYYFNLPIPFLKNIDGEIGSIVFSANSDLEPKAIFSPKKFLVDNFSIDLKVEEMSKLPSDFVVSVDGVSQDYTDEDNLINGVTNLIPVITNLIDDKAFNVGYSANIYKDKSKQFSASGAIKADINNSIYDLSANVIDVTNNNANGISINGRHQNNTTYLSVNDDVLKGYITNTSVNDMIKTVEDYLGKSLYNYIIDKITEISKNEKVQEIIDNMDSISEISNIFSLSADENNIYVTIDTNELGVDCGVLSLTINHSNNDLIALNVFGLSYQGYGLDISLNISKIDEFENIDVSKYSSLDSLTNFLTIIPSLINSKKYTLDANFTMQKNPNSFVSSTDTKINAGLQADLTTNDIYGFGLINDEHYLKFNSEDNSNLYILYDNYSRLDDNKNTKVKIQYNGINDIFAMISNFIKTINKEEANTVSLSETLSSLLSSPTFIQTIRNAVFGITSDKLKITTNDLSSPLADGTTNQLVLSGNLSLFGLNSSPFKIEIGYSLDKLTYLGISDINIDGVGYINGKISLVSWNNEMASNNLSPSDSGYYDFEDIKTLVYFGINTALLSTTNYWYVSGTFTLGVLMFDIPVNYNIYIHNNNTKVELTMDITISKSTMKLDLFGGLLFDQRYTNQRTVNLYYLDNYIYINRVDGSKETNYKMTIDDLFSDAHPIHAITKNVMTFSDLIVKAIDDAIDESKEYGKTNPTKWEQVLNELSHDKDNKKFIIDLNFAELATNPDLTKLNIEVYYKGTNDKDYVLDHATINMVASVTIDINLTFTLKLEDYNGDYSSFINNAYSFAQQAKDQPSNVNVSF